jgi:predicted flap endonuclease-1-like 5' DNA nuclease
MTVAAWFVFGLFLGWLIEWMIDHLYWRRTRNEHLQSRERDLAIQEAALQGRDRQIAEREAELERREADLKLAQQRLLMPPASVLMQAPPAPIDAGARSAFITASGEDDLEAIEGIGPKIASLLRESGIETFAQLAGTSVPALRDILDRSGPHFSLAKPDTWPEQATLLVRHEFAQFESLKRSLIGGVRPKDSSVSLS